MALYSLYCAEVPLRNCSLTHSLPFVKNMRYLLYVRSDNSVTDPDTNLITGQESDPASMQCSFIIVLMMACNSSGQRTPGACSHNHPSKYRSHKNTTKCIPDANFTFTSGHFHHECEGLDLSFINFEELDTFGQRTTFSSIQCDGTTPFSSCLSSCHTARHHIAK